MKTLQQCKSVKVVNLCLLLLCLSSTVVAWKRQCENEWGTWIKGEGCVYEGWWKPWYLLPTILGTLLIGAPCLCCVVWALWKIFCEEECRECCGCDEEPQDINYPESVALTSNTTEKIKCYMCFKRIDKMDWRRGYHRKICFNNNKDEIRRFPMPYMVKCRKCDSTLRLWPQRLGSRFTCENQERRECALMNKISGISDEEVAAVAVIGNDGKYEIRNTGENRLNCFLCDFDLCKECVFREVHSSDAFVASCPPPITKNEIAIEMEEDIPTQSEIMRFAQPLEVFCSNCGDKLRLWPKKASAFTCDNMEKMDCALINSSGCPDGAVPDRGGTWKINNNGSNRFNCFSCSFDLCIQCVLRHLSNPPPSYEATVTNELTKAGQNVSQETPTPLAKSEEDALIRKGDSMVDAQIID